MERTSESNEDVIMKPVTFEQLKACQLSNWYPKFRSLNNSSNPTSNAEQYPNNNVTIRSIIIPSLPEKFIEYLKSDTVILPKGAKEVSSLLPTDADGGWSSDEDNQNSDSSEEAHFPELNCQIQNAIDKLGPCMPKLNWSAPKDVTWLNESTLKCGTVGDVYLLLKSSDFCMFDLEHALDDIDMSSCRDCSTNSLDANPSLEYELILRKWSNLHSSMEFRCFVANHELVGICQRNHTQHYPHLKREYMDMRALVMDFFIIYIRENFADKLVADYVFDVYVDKNERVWLIDFNLWSTRTDGLMFTWKELVKFSDESDEDQANDDLGVINIDNTRPNMRVVMNENEIHSDPLASYRAPIDAVDLASDQAGSQTFKEFMAMCARPSELDSDE